MRVGVKIAVVIAVVAAVYIGWRLGRTPEIHKPPGVAVQVTNSKSQGEPRSTPSGEILTDRQDPEFTKRVLPIVREFLVSLDRAGVNPIKGELPYSSIRVHHGPNGMTCRFLIGESWSATTYIGVSYSGILHFGERGTNNPFRAISHADTNALIRLSESAIRMPKAEAERIIDRVSDAFQIDRSKSEKPEVYAERMFNYDLGMYSAQYRKKGADPVNQMNYPISFSIRATSPTTAVLVSYLHDGKTGR
jgi:hypothetical protein